MCLQVQEHLPIGCMPVFLSRFEWTMWLDGRRNNGRSDVFPSDQHFLQNRCSCMQIKIVGPRITVSQQVVSGIIDKMQSEEQKSSPSNNKDILVHQLSIDTFAEHKTWQTLHDNVCQREHRRKPKD